MSGFTVVWRDRRVWLPSRNFSTMPRVMARKFGFVPGSRLPIIGMSTTCLAALEVPSTRAALEIRVAAAHRADSTSLAISRCLENSNSRWDSPHRRIQHPLTKVILSSGVQRLVIPSMCCEKLKNWEIQSYLQNLARAIRIIIK